MKVEIEGHTLRVIREAGDRKYHGVVNGAGESNLLYAIKNHLNSLGFDLIKKRMWKDGHMMDDIQQYLRARKPGGDTPDIYIYNGFWQIRGAEVDWNEGEVTLNVEFDVFGKQPNCREMAIQLLEKSCKV